jgi:hypothetical protein
MWKVCLPILLWGVVIIVVYATSMQQLDMVSADSKPDPAAAVQIHRCVTFRSCMCQP